LQSLTSEFEKLGFQIIAISPDSPEKLKQTAEKFALGFRLLSDSDMQASQKLGIAFQLDDATALKYKNEYKVDLEGASGRTHHQLPVPSAFVVDQIGMVHFAYVTINFKLRVDPEVLLAAVKALQKQGATDKSAPRRKVAGPERPPFAPNMK
jgi:peroxiredoxin